MQFEEQIPRRYPTKAEMAKRVARFAKLKGSDGGLPDSYHPSAERILYNVIGFQPPAHEGGALQSPVGAKAARMAAIPISEGFNLGFCRAQPGKGPMMHNHDTNETFICISGRWRASWEQPNGKIDYFDLDPLDVISFPPGCIRRFENISKGPKNRYATLMFVIAGDGPHAEFTMQAMAELAAAGLLDGKPRRAAVHRSITPVAGTRQKSAAPGRATSTSRGAARDTVARPTKAGQPAARATRRAR